MTTNLTWRVSPNDVDAALETMREAAGVAHDRDVALTARGLKKWPADAQRIFVCVEDAARLFTDEKHGETFHRLARQLTREGRHAGVLLEIQW